MVFHHTIMRVASHSGQGFIEYKQCDVILLQIKKTLNSTLIRLKQDISTGESHLLDLLKMSGCSINQSADALSEFVSTSAVKLTSSITDDARAHGDPVSQKIIIEDIKGSLVKAKSVSSGLSVIENILRIKKVWKNAAQTIKDLLNQWKDEGTDKCEEITTCMSTINPGCPGFSRKIFAE